MKKLLIIISMLILSGLSLAACSNTAEGIGRDVEHAGQKIQDTF